MAVSVFWPGPVDGAAALEEERAKFSAKLEEALEAEAAKGGAIAPFGEAKGYGLGLAVGRHEDEVFPDGKTPKMAAPDVYALLKKPLL